MLKTSKNNTRRKTNIKQDAKNVNINDVGYIYIIKSSHSNGVMGWLRAWYKIGKTVNLKNRLATYNYSFPEDKYSYAFVSEKIYNLSEVERYLIRHIMEENKFIFSIHRKEWFHKKRNCNHFMTMSFLSNIINEMVDLYFHEWQVDLPKVLIETEAKYQARYLSLV